MELDSMAPRGMITNATGVELLPAHPDLWLSPCYDEALGILFLTSRAPHHWPHGGTVDGVLTLDLTNDRCLAHVELTWPRDRWSCRESVLPKGAKPEGSHAIRLPRFSSRAVDDSYRVQVFRNASEVIITMRSTEPDRRVSIGEHIDALLTGSELLGFLVELV